MSHVSITIDTWSQKIDLSWQHLEKCLAQFLNSRMKNQVLHGVKETNSELLESSQDLCRGFSGLGESRWVDLRTPDNSHTPVCVRGQQTHPD